MSNIDNFTTVSEADPFWPSVVWALELGGERHGSLPVPLSWWGGPSSDSVSGEVWNSAWPSSSSADAEVDSLRRLEHKNLNKAPCLNMHGQLSFVSMKYKHLTAINNLMRD